MELSISKYQGRREWLKMNVLMLFIAAFGFFGNVAAGCSDVLNGLRTWIPIGLSAFGAVLTFINPAAGSVLNLAFNAASGLWTALSGAITTYENNTNAGQAPTLLDKVIVAIQALATQLTSILNSVTLTNPNDQNYATEAITLLINTLKSIAAGLQANHPTARAAISKTARTAAIHSAQASVKDFKSSYNAIAVKYGHSDRQVK